MGALWQDVNYGLRMLLRKPGFTAVALLTLALGVGATTSIFSVVDAALLRNRPVRAPERVVVFHTHMPKVALPRAPVSPLQYLEYGRQTDAFEVTAVFEVL